MLWVCWTEKPTNYFNLLTGGDHCLGLIMDGAVCVRMIIRNQLDPYPALANAQFLISLSKYKMHFLSWQKELNQN